MRPERARVGDSRCLGVEEPEGKKETRMPSPKNQPKANGSTKDKRPRSSYEVTSEGRVVVNVQKLMESDAVQRIASMAAEIAALSAAKAGR